MAETFEFLKILFNSLMPSKAVNPESFNILRSPNPHLTFGTGVHVCLGLKLARAETEVALKQLFSRFPDVSLAAGEKSVIWSRRIGLRSIKEMRLKLTR